MKQEDESRWVIGTIEDGRKSDYWKLLKQCIIEWIDDENKRLDSYKQTSIAPDEVQKYNRTVDRVRYLNRMLTINETIVGYHRTFIEKVKDKVEDMVQKGESFFEEVFRR